MQHIIFCKILWLSFYFPPSLLQPLNCSFGVSKAEWLIISKESPACLWLDQTSGVLTIIRSATQELMTADRTPKQETPPQVLIYNSTHSAHRHTGCLETAWFSAANWMNILFLTTLSKHIIARTLFPSPRGKGLLGHKSRMEKI